jgi:hypothetical protein
MTKYAQPLEARWKATIGAILRRIQTLESRTSGIDSGFPLMALPAVIDPAYTTGDPKALINGATVLTGPFKHLAAYTPAAGDSVIALPIVSQQTYVILGKVL